MKKRIGVLTGGGDVPGLNPAMKEVVLNALEDDYEVLGIRRGWGGLLWYDLDEPSTHDYYIYQLDRNSVRRIDRTGGTFLHTSRTNPQKVKQDDIPGFLKESSLGKPIDEQGTMDYTDHVLSVLDHLGIDALVSIGGDDTLSYSVRLNKEGFPVVAIPKTMDNDVNGTDYCIGFSTAVTRSVDAITQLRTSVGSHERIGVFELFGRNSGETSLISAYLAYVDRALISEVPFNMEKLADFLLEDERNCPSNYAILTVSEGATFEGGDIIETGPEDAFGHRKLGGIGEMISEEIKQLTGQHIMYQKFGYVMRSGAPDSLDRMVAMAYGNLAMQLIQREEYGKLVALQGGKYTTVPVETVLAGKKHVDVEAYYDKENYKPKVKNFLGVPMFLT
jgi:ATP-dependent phosphofructokinase / diphosphate-dependent phosphofructokinase